MKTINYRLRQKLDEVYTVVPNDLGNPLLTEIYHGITRFFKTMPFIIIIPITITAVLLFYLFYGSLVIKLTSLLQYGF